MARRACRRFYAPAIASGQAKPRMRILLEASRRIGARSSPRPRTSTAQRPGGDTYDAVPRCDWDSRWHWPLLRRTGAGRARPASASRRHRATTRSARATARKTTRRRRTPASTRTTSASRRAARSAPTAVTPPASTRPSTRATTTSRTAIANCKHALRRRARPSATSASTTRSSTASSAAIRCARTTRPELKACRAAFKACAASVRRVSGPVVDPEAVQDRREGRRTRRAARTAARTSRSRRMPAATATTTASRAAAPIARPARRRCRPALDAAVAQCKADQAGRHRTLQRRSTACIDQAQAVAFQCRDDAREAAKPGFEACRQAFKACVQGCPAASPSGAFLD